MSSSAYILQKYHESDAICKGVFHDMAVPRIVTRLHKQRYPGLKIDTMTPDGRERWEGCIKTFRVLIRHGFFVPVVHINSIDNSAKFYTRLYEKWMSARQWLDLYRSGLIPPVWRDGKWRCPNRPWLEHRSYLNSTPIVRKLP